MYRIYFQKVVLEPKTCADFMYRLKKKDEAMF